MSDLESANGKPGLRIGVVDDAFAAPDRDSVELSDLEIFCEAAGEHDELSGRLLDTTGIAAHDPSAITDSQVAALFESQNQFKEIQVELESLFADFKRRRADLDAIVEGIKKFPGVSVERFASKKELEGVNELSVVFLDYNLKDGKNESKAVARDIYKAHRAFIVLMSDKPDAEQDEENFRRETRLLRGFFRYLPKRELVNSETVYRTLLFVPENSEVCHTIHDLIDALEATLGGNIEELERDELPDNPVVGQAIRRFMNVLRTLPLQDYAILCELTLSDEGHPLGDYIRRLFGSHLVHQVFATQDVAGSLRKLDQLRFTEFLPVASDPSDSLKELYAASLVEPITNPWGEHPWENESTDGGSDE
ncbi:hypothetical protein Mal15_65080 [Stieleria maiorica]|uniref:Uncharacterized protein n=1 Tax=Stieleria maiorica TaxID=2795974 RepID=A0A5B9MQU2_9BACT|nr:hypothetical protein [Stieleria maiorica]QEG02387.1 hypothetical protein Mal15_65080 [Stieleria maiorica]